MSTLKDFITEITEYEVEWFMDQDPAEQRRILTDIFRSGFKGFENYATEGIVSKMDQVGILEE